jgi:hypothetical protein
VTQNDPRNIDILEMLSSHFSSVGSKAELRAILSSDFDMLVLFGEHDSDQVKVNWGYDHL